MRILELGYISKFIDVKQLMWADCIGWVSFTSRQTLGSLDLASRRIQHFLGADSRIYKQADFASYTVVPSLTVKQVSA